MSVFRFKVYFEEDESISREIEIKSSQTFENFHKIIQKAIGFDDAHPASFFVSNDSWRKQKEIVLLQKKNTKGLQGTWMHETKIASLVDDPHQKFIYEFDPEGMTWTLYVELMKITPLSSVTYPRIAKSEGASPSQYRIAAPVNETVDAELLNDEEEDEYINSGVPDQYRADDNEDEDTIAGENQLEYKATLMEVEEAEEEREPGDESAETEEEELS